MLLDQTKVGNRLGGAPCPPELDLRGLKREPVMRTRTLFIVLIVGSLGFASAWGEVERRETNNGMLILEDIPEIPQGIVDDLNQYQNTRSAGFLDWGKDGESLYVTTRFGDVNQVHTVSMPGGARRQVTFFDEPVSQVQRRPGSEQLVFAMDAGGSEFSQLFLLNPATSKATMVSDGEPVPTTGRTRSSTARRRVNGRCAK